MLGVFGDCVWYCVQVQLNDSEWHIGTQPVSRWLVDRLCVFVKVYSRVLLLVFVSLSFNFLACENFCLLVGWRPNLVQ